MPICEKDQIVAKGDLYIDFNIHFPSQINEE